VQSPGGASKPSRSQSPISTGLPHFPFLAHIAPLPPPLNGDVQS
jgi:hypothetical protein